MSGKRKKINSAFANFAGFHHFGGFRKKMDVRNKKTIRRMGHSGGFSIPQNEKNFGGMILQAGNGKNPKIFGNGHNFINFEN